MKPLAQNTLIQNRYLVVHLIGKGGMGEVYLAVDQRLGSAVALKRTFFAGDEMLGNAFEREARTLARMRHPVLPKVSDHFGENEEQFLVMEHISGDDLAKRLDAAGKPFPVSWVMFWADQLLDALSYLHTHEPPIIHRDIKPQNLKLTDENHVILLDFGLSKTSTGQTNISQSGSTGSVVGYTPHYAPMEQIRGIGTSPRSDLYSLSATLYQLMTNTVPVDALTRADAMLNGLPDPIRPLSELNPEVPKLVSDVIIRGMEVSQEKRYANAREMQRVLRKAFNEIQQASNASTAVFSAEQAEAIGAVVPDAAERGSALEKTASVLDSQPGVEAPIAPDAGIDLDATMAYDPSPALNTGRQADIKTEVILGGTGSIPVTGVSEPELPEVDEQPQPTVSVPTGPEPTASFGVAETSAGPGADATVPFIAIDQADLASVGSAPTNDFGTPATPEFLPPLDSGTAAESKVSLDEVPYFGEPASEPEPVAAAYAQPGAAAVPAKRSSGKALAVVGILAVLVLLGAGIGGGIWAYMKYSQGAIVTPSPEPSPSLMPSATPSAEPTADANVNASDPNVNTGDEDSSTTVEPTPSPTVQDEPTPSGTRPTPRPLTTPGPGRTPSVRPTPPPRKTPQPRPTVLQ